MKYNILGMEHIHITLLTCQRHDFIWVLFGFCKISQEATAENCWRTPTFKKRMLLWDKFSVSLFFLFKACTWMRNTLSFRAASTQPQVPWLTFMQNVDRQIPQLFINTKQSLQTSLSNHIPSCKHSYFLSSHSFVYGS